MNASTNQLILDHLKVKGFVDVHDLFKASLEKNNQNLDISELESKIEGTVSNESKINDVFDVETVIASYNPCENDPYGSVSMPIYQTATFKQPGATDFGDYDYTRSGNPTRDALQNLVAKLEEEHDAKAYAFTTGMAALNAVIRLVKSGDEVIVNDDSYGGTYRLMSKIATRHGIIVKYVNMSGVDGPKTLLENISSITKLVMIESPTNPMQRICDIQKLADICHNNNHPTGTFLSIDNTMMSPILSRPLNFGADIVIHSATKFMSGHADTMAGVVTVNNKIDNNKTLSEWIYFYQNAEGTGLAPFDCWLVLRGIRTMPIRVYQQQTTATVVASWLRTVPSIKKVIYCGFSDHPDYDIHKKQASGGGCVICFTTDNISLSKHIVTVTKLFKITVSFGSVSSVISLPGQMSHSSIPPEVRSVREFPEDIVRMSIGLESAKDLINDLKNAIESFQQS